MTKTKLIREGYSFHEYITGTEIGTNHCIDCGLVLDAEHTVKYDLDIRYDATSARRLMGFNGSAMSYFGISATDSAERLGSTDLTSNHRIEFLGTENSLSSFVDGQKVFSTTIQDTTKHYGKASLFSINGNTTSTSYNNANGVYLYEARFYENDELVRDMIPCKRLEDNVVGLYDIINDVFYTTTGNGSFTCGDSKVFYEYTHSNTEKILVKADRGEYYHFYDYIQTDGNSWFEVCPISSADSYSVEAVVYPCENGGSRQFFVGHAPQNEHTCGIFIDNASPNKWNFSHTETVNYNSFIHIYHEYDVESGIDSYSINGRKGTMPQTANYSGVMSIFKLYNWFIDSERVANGGRVMFVKIKKNGKLVRHLIPAKKFNVIGLYDLVNDTFYTQKGSGTLTVGKLHNWYEEKEMQVFQCRKITTNKLVSFEETNDYSNGLIPFKFDNSIMIRGTYNGTDTSISLTLCETDKNYFDTCNCFVFQSGTHELSNPRFNSGNNKITVDIANISQNDVVEITVKPMAVLKTEDFSVENNKYVPYRQIASKPKVLIEYTKEGYTFYDYIENTSSNNYINLNYNVQENTEIEVDFQYVNYDNSDRKLFGCVGKNGLAVAGGLWRFISNGYTMSTIAVDNKRHTFKSSYKNFYLDNKLLFSNSSDYTFNDSSDYYLFCSYYNRKDGNSATIRLYSFKVIENGTIAKHLLPCKRNSDNKIGLFDRITETFYENLGDTDFVCGQEGKKIARRVVKAVGRLKSKNLLRLDNRTIVKVDASLEPTDIGHPIDVTKCYESVASNGYMFKDDGMKYAKLEKDLSVTVENRNTFYGLAIPIKVKPNTTYTFKALYDKYIIDSLGDISLLTSDGYITSIFGLSYDDIGGHTVFNTFTTANDTEYVYIILSSKDYGRINYYNIMFEEGDTSTTYVPYYQTFYDISEESNGFYVEGFILDVNTLS